MPAHPSEERADARVQQLSQSSLCAMTALPRQHILSRPRNNAVSGRWCARGCSPGQSSSTIVRRVWRWVRRQCCGQTASQPCRCSAHGRARSRHAHLEAAHCSDWKGEAVHTRSVSVTHNTCERLPAVEAQKRCYPQNRNPLASQPVFRPGGPCWCAPASLHT